MTPDAKRVCHVAPAREFIAFDLGAHRVDIRGWPVFACDARRVGVVDRLMIEQATTRVRYVSVALAKDAVDDLQQTPSGSVLVPIGVLRRYDQRRAIVLESLTSGQVAGAPRLHARPVTRADEVATLVAYGLAASADVHGGDLYSAPQFDEGRLHVEAPRAG